MGLNPNSYHQVAAELFSMYLISRNHQFFAVIKVFGHKARGPNFELG